MSFVEQVGSIATLLTVFIYLPQAIKVWKTRHTKDLSLPMYILAVTASFAWVIYGLLLPNVPVFITNSIVFIFSGFTLVVLLKKK